MKTIKFAETEIIETDAVIEFPDGPVKVTERETHEFKRIVDAGACRQGSRGTRLVVDDAFAATRGLVVKARAEIAELNSILMEMSNPSVKAR